MRKLFENKFLTFSIIGGVIVFAVVAFVLMSVTATTKAAVLNTDTSAGTTITDAMVTEIDVPKDTPGDFYKTKNSLVGERVTSNIKKNQLIYPTNVMSSVNVSDNVDGEFVTTSIKIPDEQAIGGVLTAGDVVDVSVVPKDGEVQNLAKALPGFEFDTSINGGIYFILSNVKILDSTTAVSSAQGSNLSTANGESGDKEKVVTSTDSSSYYMVSLSYADYKKLRIAEQYGNVFLSLSPSQNKENAPLIDQMTKPVDGGLADASVNEKDVKKTDSKHKQTSK